MIFLKMKCSIFSFHYKEKNKKDEFINVRTTFGPSNYGPKK